MIFQQLFWSFLQIGLFSIGGGYAAIPLIQSLIVEKHSWLTMSAFTDLVTIAEMTPGPIAVNAATFVGLQIAGTLGAIVATLGCIFPSLFLVSILAWFYRKYRQGTLMQSVLSVLHPAVVAIIVSAGLVILLNVLFGSRAIVLEKLDLRGFFFFISAFFALRKFRWNPILVMSLCGAISLFVGIVAN